MKKRRTPKVASKPVARLIHPLPPRRSQATMLDRRTEFAALSTLAPPTADVQRAFVTSKLKSLRTHPALHPADRESIVTTFKAVAPMVATEDVGPVPGGVGYGVFYNSAFKNNFAGGTSISWEIVCPTTPGGNVNTWLYVT